MKGWQLQSEGAGVTWSQARAEVKDKKICGEL